MSTKPTQLLRLARVLKRDAQNEPSHKLVTYRHLGELAKLMERVCEHLAKEPTALPKLSEPVRRCLEIVCAEFDVTPEDVFSGSREEAVCRARWTVFWALKHCRGFRYGLSRTARIMGVDHTTVSYGLKRMDELAMTDPSFDRLVESVLQKISGEAIESNPPKVGEHSIRRPVAG